MFKAHKSSNKKFQKRRNFLTRTAAVGGMAIIGATVGPARAAKSLANETLETLPVTKSIWKGNVTVDDFSSLLGKRFRLLTENGTKTHARLIEASSPKTRRALRFRREHFSIVFDVPTDVELFQGHYRISHPQIGSMELFMVPVDLPEKFNRLEAVFA